MISYFGLLSAQILNEAASIFLPGSFFLSLHSISLGTFQQPFPFPNFSYL